MKTILVYYYSLRTLNNENNFSLSMITIRVYKQQKITPKIRFFLYTKKNHIFALSFRRKNAYYSEQQKHTTSYDYSLFFISPLLDRHLHIFIFFVYPWPPLVWVCVCPSCSSLYYYYLALVFAILLLSRRSLLFSSIYMRALLLCYFHNAITISSFARRVLRYFVVLCSFYNCCFLFYFLRVFFSHAILCGGIPFPLAPVLRPAVVFSMRRCVRFV